MIISHSNSVTLVQQIPLNSSVFNFFSCFLCTQLYTYMLYSLKSIFIYSVYDLWLCILYIVHKHVHCMILHEFHSYVFFAFFLKICLCFYCNQVQFSRSRNSTVLTLIQILAFLFFQQCYSCSSSLRIYSLGSQIRSAHVPRFHFKHNLQIIGLR